MNDEQCEERVPSFDKSSSTLSMTQMYSQQLEQQRNALKYQEIQPKMDEALNNSSLPEDVKSLLYNDLLQDYKFTMVKSTQSNNPLLNLPVHQNARTTRTTSL